MSKKKKSTSSRFFVVFLPVTFLRKRDSEPGKTADSRQVVGENASYKGRH
jgi:hypothetical protein